LPKKALQDKYCSSKKPCNQGILKVKLLLVGFNNAVGLKNQPTKQILGISVLYGLNPNYAVEGEG
jgi:hypothetical protein